MGYIPKIISNFKVELPELNWKTSVAVDVLDFSDNTEGWRVFWQTEPNCLSGIRDKLIRNHKFFDLILCWDSEILSACGNARYFPPGSVWTQEPDTSQKQFQASFLVSSKNLCYGHEFRLGIYNVITSQAIRNHLPLKKHMSPPYLPSKRDFLVPFQYSVIMENDNLPNYFTEKLLDAFATKTIPIYWGCSNLQEFFNTDGILTFKDWKELRDILCSLSPDFYKTKEAAIEENYQKSLAYTDRTGNVVKAITDSWIPKGLNLHSGEPNVP